MRGTSGCGRRWCGSPAIARLPARTAGAFPARWRLAMKLYCAPGSSSLLPHIALLEAGLPFTAILIDEHTKAIEGGGDYKDVNPLGYVPALVLDDGTLLTEGPAIVQYIADLAPGK